MSTKTTLKRIALVAVSALGFGLVTAVVPASAVASDVSKIAVGSSQPARVGVFGGTTTITLTSGTLTSNVTVTAQIASAPASSTAAGLDFATKATSVASFVSETATTTTSAVASATFALLAGTSEKVDLKLKADVAGTYQVLVTLDGNTSTGYSAGKKSAVYTLTTAGTPTAMTITKIAGAIVGGAADDFGLTLGISLKDANGNATVLGLNEGIAVSQTALVAAVTLNNAATAAFDSSSSTVSGMYILRAEGKTIAAAATNIITVSGDGVLPATLIQNYSASMTAAIATPAGGTLSLVADSLGTALTANTTYTGGTATWQASSASTHYFKYAPASAPSAATNYAVNVTAVDGTKYATAVAVAAAGTSGVVAISQALTEDDAPDFLTVAVAAGTNPSHTIAYDAPVVNKVAVLSPSTGILTATGSSVTFVAKVTDQFGAAMAGKSVTVTVTGRNTVTSKALGITDASGLVTYAFTDAGTSGTSDSVVFTSGATSSSAYTLTYGTVTVAKVSFTGGSTTAGAANATTTIHGLEADQTPESATQDAIVTVTDANASLLVGVPVTFTVSGDGAAITSTTKTVYTGTDGKATAKVYAWLAGKYTVTATSGGITGSGDYTFANSRAADARVLSATADGGTITAKIVDRFGNPVKGANVYLTKTGSGFFGSGNSKTKDTTGANGTVEFIFNGTGEVTVSTLDYDALPGANADAQTCALAGNFSCASGATAAVAFTATTAGTTLVNEKNVGSSYAPAGVSSVKLTITAGGNAAAGAAATDAANAASDAAAEAIDAANAATDAANLAAEAADAATVAAEEARDAADAATAAVEELATQVATLMAALKAQITTLANTVAKIAKKVKA